MKYGPFYIFKCPECPQTFSDMGIMSATGSSKLYSDGQNKFSFDLNDHCRLMRCENCKSIYWKYELETIGTYTDYDNEDHQNLIYKTKKISTPTIAQYFQAIKLKIYRDEEDLVYLRKKIWHSYNNRILFKKKIFIYKNEEKRWRNNINQLINLLVNHSKKFKKIKEDYKIINTTKSHLSSIEWKTEETLSKRIDFVEIEIEKKNWINELMLILAELHRNLEDYNKSIKILNNISIIRNDGLNAMKKNILEQCNNENSFVVEIV